jgi:putative oxidoreductase
MFMAHGTSKFFGFPAPFSGGTPALTSMIGVAVALELVGGALSDGRPVHASSRVRPLGVDGVSAYFIAHAPSGLLADGQQMGELAALYSFVFLYIAAAAEVRGAWIARSADRATDGAIENVQDRNRGRPRHLVRRARHRRQRADLRRRGSGAGQARRALSGDGADGRSFGGGKRTRVVKVFRTDKEWKDGTRRRPSEPSALSAHGGRSTRTHAVDEQVDDVAHPRALLVLGHRRFGPDRASLRQSDHHIKKQLARRTRGCRSSGGPARVSASSRPPHQAHPSMLAP